jgi:hypothetical protein
LDARPLLRAWHAKITGPLGAYLCESTEATAAASGRVGRRAAYWSRSREGAIVLLRKVEDRELGRSETCMKEVRSRRTRVVTLRFCRSTYRSGRCQVWRAFMLLQNYRSLSPLQFALANLARARYTLLQEPGSQCQDAEPSPCCSGQVATARTEYVSQRAMISTTFCCPSSV